GAFPGHFAMTGRPPPGRGRPGRADCFPSRRSWFYPQGDGDFRGHARLEQAVRVGHTHLDAEDLMLALVGALDVARRELALRGDLFDGAGEASAGVTIDADLDPLTQTDAAEVGLRHVDFHPQVVGAEHAHDDLVGRDHVALADAQHFDDGLLG